MSLLVNLCLDLLVLHLYTTTLIQLFPTSYFFSTHPQSMLLQHALTTICAVLQWLAINDTTNVVRVVSLFSYAPVVRLSLYSTDAPVLLLLFPLKLHRLSHSSAHNVDCDWCPPFAASLLLMLMTSIYCYYCCFCLCSVGTSSFYLYRLSCPILAAAVLLLLYYADAAVTLLCFHHSFPWEHPPLTTRFSDISCPFRQTPDCSDIFTFFTVKIFFVLEQNKMPIWK